MIAQKLSQVKNISRRSLLVLQGLVLAAATILPLVISGSAGASQLTNRLVTASTAVPSATAVTNIPVSTH